MVPSFDSLPSEILQMVFRSLQDSILNLPQLTLVCSDWKCRFQKSLYSRVYLNKISQVEKFLCTLEQNSYLGSLVTELSLGFRNDPHNDSSDTTFAKLFTLLPNLKSIRFGYGPYFKLLFDALSANQLLSLCYVNPPDEDEQIYDYTNCVRLLKDRLKNLTVEVTNYPREDDEFTDDYAHRHEGVKRVIKELDQFESLEKLIINYDPYNIIELIEKATHSQSLQQLNLKLIQSYASFGFKPGMISNVPRPSNVSHLKFCASIFSDARLVQYIIHKFPCLKTLEIHGLIQQKSDMDEYTLKSFFNYLSKIENVTASSIPCNEESTEIPIGSFWEIISQKYSLAVHFWYQPSNRPFNSPGKMKVEIEGGRCRCTMYYRTYESNTKFVNLIKNYGHCINEFLVIGTPTRVPDPWEKVDITQFEALVLQPLKYCNNLKNLKLKGRTLAGINVSGYELFSKQTLDLLSLSDCSLEDDEVVYKKISQSICHIKKLELYKTCNRYVKEITGFRNINMAETDIGTLSLTSPKPQELLGLIIEHVLLVKITIQQTSSYYIHRFKRSEGDKFKPVSEKVYRKECNKDKCLLISLSCNSLDNLEMNYRGTVVKLALDKAN